METFRIYFWAGTKPTILNSMVQNQEVNKDELDRLIAQSLEGMFDLMISANRIFINTAGSKFGQS